MRISKLILIVVLFFAFCLLSSVTGCGKKPREETIRMPVSAIKVQRGNLNETLFYVGDIKAEDEAIVYPKVFGKIMQEVAREGDIVKEGDVLAYIDRDEIGFEFNKAPVEAPIDGIVGNVYIDFGTTVSPQTPICSVVNMDTVAVKVNIVERDLPRVKKGQSAQVSVDAYGDGTFKGVIDRVSPVVDLASRTALVEIKISNDDHRLRPGMFARIKILIEEKRDVLIIPRDAIIKVGSLSYVFVVKPDNTVRRRTIETGIVENNKFEVINGLDEGEIIVTMGNTRLKEGDVVKIIESP